MLKEGREGLHLSPLCYRTGMILRIRPTVKGVKIDHNFSGISVDDQSVQSYAISLEFRRLRFWVREDLRM